MVMMAFSTQAETLQAIDFKLRTALGILDKVDKLRIPIYVADL